MLPGSNGNEGILRIPQSSNIPGTSPSDCLVSYPGHSLVGGSYPSAEWQSVYFTAPANWAKIYKEILNTVSIPLLWSSLDSTWFLMGLDQSILFGVVLHTTTETI